ncbi:hypothetical protein UlMin_032116 [Ulmus minor]
MESEARGLWHPHTDAIVVTLHIAGRKVFRILVDNGSSTDILFKSTFNRMNLVGVKIEPTTSSLSGFTGDSISSEGILNLPVELGSSPCQHIQAVEFVLVDCPSSYNAIIGCPTLNKIRAVTSTYHLLVKFPTVGGIGILRGDQTESREIYEAANRSTQIQGIKSSTKSRDEPPVTNIPNENGSINNSETIKAAGVHGVNAIHLRDGVHSNVVLVKKANGNWRVCVDFTDLNRACPKDSFPLPRIDQLVDATAGHELLSFMDAYSGYNQIRMHEEDREHTAFLTNQGLYCYKVMPFGLKNAGATYQRLVNKMSKNQIGKTMEFPLKQVFQKLEASGRLAKWSIELDEFDIQFKP